MNEQIKQNRIGNIYGSDRGTGFAGNVWDVNGIAPSLTTMQGGGREPMVIEYVDLSNERQADCKSGNG